MPPTMQQIADRAVALAGTPFRHQGRQPGLGVDCLGVLVCAVGREAELVDRRDYPEDPPGDRLLPLLEERAVELQHACVDAAPVGAILTFWEDVEDRAHVRHVAIRTSGGIVHAIRKRPAREVAISAYWRHHFWRAFRWSSASG